MSDPRPKPAHGVTGRSAVLSWISGRAAKAAAPSEMEYVEFPDAAADAALRIAEEASNKADRLGSQRNTMTAAHLAFVTAILGFNYRAGTEAAGAAWPSILLLGLIGAFFAVLVRQIGCAEVYYFTMAQRGREIVQRHYKIRDLHWTSHTAYTRELGWGQGLFNMHSYRFMVSVNIAAPALGALMLIVRSHG